MSISPTPSSVETEKKPFPGPNTDPTAPKETIVPDGVKSRHVEDEELDGGDSSIEATISEREMSWQRTAVLLFTEYIVLGAFYSLAADCLSTMLLPRANLPVSCCSHPCLPLLVPGARHGWRHDRHACCRSLSPLHLAYPLAVLHGVNPSSKARNCQPPLDATKHPTDEYLTVDPQIPAVPRYRRRRLLDLWRASLGLVCCFRWSRGQQSVHRACFNVSDAHSAVHRLSQVADRDGSLPSQMGLHCVRLPQICASSLIPTFTDLVPPSFILL